MNGTDDAKPLQPSAARVDVFERFHEPLDHVLDVSKMPVGQTEGWGVLRLSWRPICVAHCGPASLRGTGKPLANMLDCYSSGQVITQVPTCRKTRWKLNDAYQRCSFGVRLGRNGASIELSGLVIVREDDDVASM